MEDRTRSEQGAPYGARLTVREIRGLLTRIGAELVQAAVEPEAGSIGDGARRIRTREFVERMRPFLRMN